MHFANLDLLSHRVMQFVQFWAGLDTSGRFGWSTGSTETGVCRGEWMIACTQSDEIALPHQALRNRRPLP
jgi:hypothetical protein